MTSAFCCEICTRRENFVYPCNNLDHWRLVKPRSGYSHICTWITVWDTYPTGARCPAKREQRKITTAIAYWRRSHGNWSCLHNDWNFHLALVSKSNAIPNKIMSTGAQLLLHVSQADWCAGKVTESFVDKTSLFLR